MQQNGKLTQGEDTGDNGGIHLALSALSEDLKRQGKTLEDKDKDGISQRSRLKRLTPRSLMLFDM